MKKIDFTFYEKSSRIRVNKFFIDKDFIFDNFLVIISWLMFFFYFLRD